MGKREKRAQQYGKLGLVSSLLAAAGALAALYLIRSGWRSEYGAIAFGAASRRPTIIGLSVLMAVVLGFLGFLGGLEGAAGGEGKAKTVGWAGFWIGAISTMAGIALGLAFYFCKM